MKIKLQRWPYFLHVFLSSQFQDPLKQDDGPGGHTGNRSDIFIHGGLGQLLNLSFTFIHQCNPQLWGSDPVAIEGGVLHQQGKMTCPAGLVMKLELRNQGGPRPRIRHSRQASIERGWTLNTCAANFEARFGSAKLASWDGSAKSGHTCITNAMCWPSFANRTLTGDVHCKSIYLAYTTHCISNCFQSHAPRSSTQPRPCCSSQMGHIGTGLKAFQAKQRYFTVAA